VVVLAQWFVTNKFLRYRFLTYGPEVVAYYSVPQEEREGPNPMCETFPRIAGAKGGNALSSSFVCRRNLLFALKACDYVRYGSGGGQEHKNAICILGLNMINDKV
jgi:hypothetical protein